MGSVERFGETRPEWHGQLERLAGVAEIGLAFCRQLASFLERDEVRAHEVAPLVTGGEPERREHPGALRNEHRVQLQVVRELARMQRPRSPECHERQPAW